jgi:DNA (cytosine-5)-methyltransferase 1
VCFSSIQHLFCVDFCAERETDYRVNGLFFVFLHGPVVQWIERSFPKRQILIRFQTGLLKFYMKSFKFIDLFAGIGGFHLAMHRLGGECVFASEIDEHARKTYEANFKAISPQLFENGLLNDDIRKIAPEEIPDFDVLCAGFPCQPFSQAGFRRGFDDNHNSERGNLFFNIAEILHVKKPNAFFLENVRGLATHDDGKTFKTILNILRDELGYSVYYKIVKATDYGLPQHRPRTFIIGFKNDNALGMGFNFPSNIPLKFNMSDVWGGFCTRQVGFTLRVGGRGSSIDDRRNWDSYMVDGLIRRLGPTEGKRMQGFPDDFVFPVTNIQAMKQLGNSVAVDAIEMVGRNLINYMEQLSDEKKTPNNMSKKTFNKGEWAEPYAFLKIIKDKKIHLSNSNLEHKSGYFDIEKVTNSNIDYDFILFKGESLILKDKKSNFQRDLKISDVISEELIEKIKRRIILESGTFEVPEFTEIENKLGIVFEKGGTSGQKADIILDFNHNNLSSIKNEGFGIKSLLGSKPTLLNASSNTNFIYSITNFPSNEIDEVNSIDTRKKIMDRITYIHESEGVMEFLKTEKDILTYNLLMVDSQMPLILGELLLHYFSLGISDMRSLVEATYKKSKNVQNLNLGSVDILHHKVKQLLLDYTCGFFPGSKWDGTYTSNGTIVVDKNGNLHGFHIVDLESFKEYLYNNTKFDTPSSSRHGFGSVFKERNGQLFFKLNLQLRYS